MIVVSQQDNEVEIKTEHAHQIKVLIEVLKEVLCDVVFEIRRDNSQRTNDDDNEFENFGAADSDQGQASSKSPAKRGCIRIKAVDPTKTMLIHLNLDSTGFSKFHCAKERVNISINLGQLYKLLRSVEKEENITLIIKKSDEDKLWISRYNPIKNRTTLDYVNLLDLDDKAFDIPQLDYETMVRMETAEFHKICKDMSAISEYVEIECTKKEVIFRCHGENSGKVITYHDSTDNAAGDTCDKSKFVQIKHVCNTGSSNRSHCHIKPQKYDLCQLVLYSKFTQLCSLVQLYLKNDFVLILRYTVATLGEVTVCFTQIKTNEIMSFKDNYESYAD